MDYLKVILELKLCGAWFVERTLPGFTDYANNSILTNGNGNFFMASRAHRDNFI